MDGILSATINALKSSKLSNYKIAQDTGISDQTISNYRTGSTKPRGTNLKILAQYLGTIEKEPPKIDLGKGTVQGEVILVPLLPVSAQGGKLNDFVVSVKKEDCEKLISPIKGADFAITISGDSMAPEYPSGSKVLVKKINSNSFIEWGRCYLIDTCNGSVIKKISPPTEEDETFGKDYITCVSVNPDPLYSPFRIPTCDIYGMYRVLMLLSEK